jgi:hypothetical protein
MLLTAAGGTGAGARRGQAVANLTSPPCRCAAAVYAAGWGASASSSSPTKQRAGSLSSRQAAGNPRPPAEPKAATGGKRECPTRLRALPARGAACALRPCRQPSRPHGRVLRADAAVERPRRYSNSTYGSPGSGGATAGTGKPAGSPYWQAGSASRALDSSSPLRASIKAYQQAASPTARHGEGPPPAAAAPLRRARRTGDGPSLMDPGAHAAGKRRSPGQPPAPWHCRRVAPEGAAGRRPQPAQRAAQQRAGQRRQPLLAALLARQHRLPAQGRLLQGLQVGRRATAPRHGPPRCHAAPCACERAAAAPLAPGARS